ncbi:expressed unknown protein [Seminavis robusta]|uniref:Histidine kinase/HSP90-like ATPase domain-containing protein n=1 Tax=Seminavis robusta TaxID=568900 RepID=A0A9N8HJ20_9STRA|nr:expressed unknown protein [Seminavis robusta]|eukprot:Sro662_g183420.1 n/a (610) ;mRNA; r:47066-48895
MTDSTTSTSNSSNNPQSLFKTVTQPQHSCLCDSKAAHFLRHEVKNGVLAAMGILESLLLEEQTDQQHHLTDLSNTLNALLSRTVDCAMTLEVVHGDYGPSFESVRLPHLLANSNDEQDTARFPVLTPTCTTTDDFPALMLDPTLLRTIHGNAVSNACKFGKPAGLVETRLSYDSKNQTLTMQVQNEPGPGHQELLKTMNTPQQQAKIFQEQAKLPCNNNTDNASEQVKQGEGNGAWILQSCARAMGGHASISFEPNRTLLTFECPALVAPSFKNYARQDSPSLAVPMDISLPVQQPQVMQAQQDEQNEDQEEEAFEIPENTWCIVVEDSAVQRKMLQRYLARAGVKPERCLLLGQTPDEIFDFIDRTTQLMREHKNDNFLIIMDENLDIVEGGTVSKTISGSCSVQKLRESLEPRDESRLLSLIRSANDSLHEQRLYQERAHGFISKGPIKQGNLLDVIKPWWKRRFAATTAKPAPAPAPAVTLPASEPPKKKYKLYASSSASSMTSLLSVLNSNSPLDRQVLRRSKTNTDASFCPYRYHSMGRANTKRRSDGLMRHSNSSPTIRTVPMGLVTVLQSEQQATNNRLCNYFFAKRGWNPTPSMGCMDSKC